jgi:hypothetical protein
MTMRLASALCAGCLTFNATAATDTHCQTQYQLWLDTRTQSALSSLPSQLVMQARLSIKHVQQQQQKQQPGWWAIKADDVKLSSQGQTAGDADYEYAFAIRLDTSGQIRQFWFADGVPAAAQEKLQGLAYYFQYSPQPETSLQQERDALGEYTASYRWQAPVLRMQKQHYQLHPVSAGNAFKALQVVESEHSLRPTHCWFDERMGQETLRFVGHSAELNFTSQQRYQLKRLDQLEPSALFQLPTALSLWPAVPSAQPALPVEQQKALLRSWLQTDRLLASDGYQLANAWRQLDAALLALPEWLPQLLAEHALTDEAMMRLFNALGQVDTETSQYVLVQLLTTQNMTPDNQFRALRALANGQQPLGEEAYWAIKSVMDEPALLPEVTMRGSFYMTLGVMLAERHGSDHSERLHQDLAHALQHASSEAAQANLITALGNSADERHVAQIKRYRDHASARVQKATARAFGSIQSPGAYAQLQQMLSSHPARQAPVTRSVLKSLANYSLQADTLNEVYHVARDAQDDGVRYEAIKTMGRQDNPAIQGQLRQLLPQESSRRNFRAIVQALHAAE